MSSIFGLLRLDDEDAVLSDVERMGASMSYRSPDRRTAKVIGPIGLGAGLMRVTHEDWNDVQPLADASGAVTLVADGHVPDAVYTKVREAFSDEELLNLTVAVAAINVWNRLNVAFRTIPGSYEPAAPPLAAAAVS